MKKKIIFQAEESHWDIHRPSMDEVLLEKDGQSFSFKKIQQKNNLTLLEDNQGGKFWVHCAFLNNGMQVFIDGEEFYLSFPQEQKKSGESDMADILSPMPGKIFKILVKEDTLVQKGDGLLILEAMKMEHVIKAAQKGKVKRFFYREGDLVEGGVHLLEFEDQHV